jgi:uncharacterized protein YbcI
MNCGDSRDAMMDALYGEESDARRLFEFFKHLDACAECSGEYRELLGTRGLLQEWRVDEELEAAPAPARAPWLSRASGWPRNRWLTLAWRAAAGVLVVAGIISVVQYLGVLGGRRVVVSEQQLTEMVHDLIMANQAEERQLIGQALVHLKEDVELARRQEVSEVLNYIATLEQRYNQNLEENSRYLKTLLAR